MLRLSLSLTLAAVAASQAAEAAFPTVASRLYTPAARAPSTFSLSKTLGDHMTLQRDTPAMVWGFAASGASVKTTFAGNSYTASAGSDGIWRQALPATPATAVGQSITFSASTGETAALNDVVFGDVYICSCVGPGCAAAARPRAYPRSPSLTARTRSHTGTGADCPPRSRNTPHGSRGQSNMQCVSQFTPSLLHCRRHAPCSSLSPPSPPPLAGSPSLPPPTQPPRRLPRTPTPTSASLPWARARPPRRRSLT
jgi:hypothetical protein